MNAIRWFVRDYAARHRHPASRALHLVGVPLAPFLFLYLLDPGPVRAGRGAFAAGYGLQWLGHTIEGNEVGEWLLLKWLVRRMAGVKS